ncbi:MAG: IS5 family transposase [Nanoarchaeota archaeon]|nr:IS5 family transposase [Nanoarchaeota archaeon]MBU1976547.1 IS5 family transposase [Nanoarchaeota archaeon]
MKIIVNKFKKVTDFCYELFRIAELPLHFSKYSNKLYSVYQKLFLLVYKQFRKLTYEELLTDLADNISLRSYLGLNKLPNYTTLIKFAKNLPTAVLGKLVLAFKELIPKPKRVAIDATGITLDNASQHYCKRIGLKSKKRPFMKTTFIVDIESYIILLCKMRKKARHDVIDAEPMMKWLAKNYSDLYAFYADRGYDKEEIFRICFELLKAYPFILQKNALLPKHKKKGRYRKETCDVFDYGEYLQRNKIETLNSMFKKRFGSNVKSRVDKLQKVEIITRVIAYNIDRLIRIGKEVILIFIRITRVSY